MEDISIIKGNAQSLHISLEELQTEIAKLLQIDNLCFLIGAGCSSHVENSIEYGIPTMAGLYSKFFKEHSCFEIGGRSAAELFECNLEKMIEVLEAISIANDIQEIDESASDKIKTVAAFIRCQVKEGIQKENSPVLATYKEFYKRISQRKRKSPINIFTTNYDLFNEIALDELGYPYNNGFTGTYKRKFSPSSYNYMYVDDMNLSKEVWEGSSFFFNLIKLHGSISWVKSDNEVWEKDFTTLGDEETVMIYPTPLKDRSTLMTPYSDLFRVMENKLMQRNTVLVTLGYSFGDDHINRIILNALAVPTFRMVVFGKSDSINKLTKIDDSRIMVINSESNIHFFDKVVKCILPHPSPEVTERTQQKAVDNILKSFADRIFKNE